MSEGRIVVAGVSPRDLLLFPAKDPSSLPGKQKFQLHECDRGASLIAELLQATPSHCIHPVHGPSALAATTKRRPLSSIVELKSIDKVEKTVALRQQFRVQHGRDLCTQSEWELPAIIPSNEDRVTTLVLHDAESDLTNTKDVIDLIRNTSPEYLIYHMSFPLGNGPIWDDVRRGPYCGNSQRDTERLIVIVSANDIRKSGVELCYSMSWERICEHFVENLGSNGQLDTLVTCAHLIVLFGCDGVIYHRGRQMAEPTLFFDPQSEEGGFERRHGGPIPGMVEAFIAGLTAGLTQFPGLSLETAVQSGLKAARHLTRLGYQSTEIQMCPVYPTMEIMKGHGDESSDVGDLNTISIPAERIAQSIDGNWSILLHNVGDPVLVAHHIVKEGVLSAANWIPVAHFGELTVLDRYEIEAFRTMFNAIGLYLASQPKKPLNFGIFGAKGTGKFFAAMQVATSAAIANGREAHHFRINLAPVSRLEDLLKGLNAVRDCTLSGRLPLVYFDGVESLLSNPANGWLDHLLPVIHAGCFLEDGVMRNIGPAIFLLSTSMSASQEGFQQDPYRTLPSKVGTPETNEFISCLQGFVDVRGINRVDELDVLYPVRRAVVLRKLLEEWAPNLQEAGKLSIDESVLDGLLLTPTYRHGLRSLKAIITMSNLVGKLHFERASLPPQGQLSLHLDYSSFVKFSQYNVLPDKVREYLAEKVHGVYLATRISVATTEDEKKALESQESMRPWSLLDEELKESARAHVADIPRKLRLISCFLASKVDDRCPVKEFEADELELLAEREHERWNSERLQRQWHLGERDSSQRTSPFLVPWRDLSKELQDIDRDIVKSYLLILPNGYEVYRAGKVTEK